jgi:hypothetical protein
MSARVCSPSDFLPMINDGLHIQLLLFFFFFAGRPYAHTKAQTTAAHHDQLDDPSSKVSSCYMAPTKKKSILNQWGETTLSILNNIERRLYSQYNDY